MHIGAVSIFMHHDEINVFQERMKTALLLRSKLEVIRARMYVFKAAFSC
jgi:hypothetical protein